MIHLGYVQNLTSEEFVYHVRGKWRNSDASNYGHHNFTRTCMITLIKYRCSSGYCKNIYLILY